jgi:enterochelin esterase-like enzyme
MGLGTEGPLRGRSDGDRGYVRPRLNSDEYRDLIDHKPSMKASATQRRESRYAGLWAGVATAATATLVVLVAVVSGSMDQSNTTLVVMGFDPDRAQLITSLLLGAFAAAAATLVTGRFGLATLLGLVGAGVLYFGTFVAETGGALGANGVNGAFDLGGWLQTLITLVVSGLIAGWAAAALAATARPSILQALAATKEAVARRPVQPRDLRYPIAVALVLVLLIVTVPAFGDLVNYAPDSLMRRGAPPAVAVATASAPAPTDSPSVAPSAGVSPTPTPASPEPSAGQPTKPWLAWLPSGIGGITTTNMAAPWKGGSASAVDVTIYTPPGYDARGNRRYPVLYEAPTGYHLWDGATNVRAALDTLIGSGSMPATIVVFIDSLGGPFPDSECADSFDHRQWFDTFVSKTVVGWVDSHYKTIAQPAARAIAGMSEGGYCAAILALHHPTVFGTSISFSGYYQAGASGTNSAAPFGGNKALLAADSPTVVAGQLSATTRAQLYFIVIAKPDQPGYGTDAAGFEKTLAADGYPYDGVPATEPHGWPQVRDYFPGAVEAWAAREVATGVF